MKKLMILLVTIMLLVGCTSDKAEKDQSSTKNNKEIVYQGNYETSYDTKVDEAGSIVTPIEIEIINSKKGALTGKIVVTQGGGVASVYEFKNKAAKELVTKLKLDKIEKSREKSTYVKEVPVDYVELEVGKEYLFFVNQDALGNHIVCNGYGSLKKENKQYKSMLTTKTYTENDFKK